MATAEKTDIENNIKSDDIEKTFLCQPCEDEGGESKAVGYCVDCREYLCQRCYDGHRVPTVTKKHKLLNKDHMTGPECYIHSCPLHLDRNIEYHCPTHSLLGCKLCYFKHKQICTDFMCIQEVCESMSSSEEFVTFNYELENIKSKCINLQEEIRCNLQNITTNHTDVIGKVRDFKQEVIEIVDNLAKTLIDKLDKVRAEEIMKMNKLSQRVKRQLTETQKIMNRVELLQIKENSYDLYIELVRSKGKVPTFEDELLSAEYEAHMKRVVFIANRDVIDLLNSNFGLGRLRSNRSVSEKVENVKKICCKGAHDANDCLVAGLVLLPGQKLFMSDLNNDNTVKLIDIAGDKIISNLKVRSSPQDMCKVTDFQIAITFPNEKKVKFIRIHTPLTVDREMAVNGMPEGIGYHSGKLVVSYSDYPQRVEVMDVQGNVVSTFNKDSNGQSLFNYPSHLAINPHNNYIYVSNYNSHSVVCLKSDGTVVATYKDNDLTHPRQITFDDTGMVYLCAEGSHNVHKITEDCKKVKVVIPSTGGLNKPLSIGYQEQEERLFIGQYKCNNIKVYQITQVCV